jgi:hypothetical protein
MTINCMNPCTSDQDCLENTPDRPYCASHSVIRGTGDVQAIGAVFGVSYSCCVSITGC